MALLRDVQRLFERTYGLEAGVDLEACVVGPRRCAELAARSDAGHAEMSDWARFFFYVENANLRLALFYADEMIETFAAPPRRAPTRLSETSLKSWIIPAFSRKAPNRMNRKM